MTIEADRQTRLADITKIMEARVERARTNVAEVVRLLKIGIPLQVAITVAVVLGAVENNPEIIKAFGLLEIPATVLNVSSTLVYNADRAQVTDEIQLGDEFRFRLAKNKLTS